MHTLIGYSANNVPPFAPFAQQNSVMVSVGHYDPKGSNGFIASELLKDKAFRLAVYRNTPSVSVQSKFPVGRYKLLEIFHNTSPEQERNAAELYRIVAGDTFNAQSDAWFRNIVACQGLIFISKNDRRHFIDAAKTLKLPLPQTCLAYPSMPAVRPPINQHSSHLNYIYSNIGHVPNPWASFKTYGWIGYPQDRKNIVGLASMFYKAFQGRTDVLLLLVVNNLYYGNYKEHTKLLRIIQQPHAPPMAIVAGPLDNHTYYNFISGVYCYASAHTYEGFGMPIIQAARLGRRIVCSNIGGAAELLDTACVVDGDPIVCMKGESLDLIGISPNEDNFIDQLKQPQTSLVHPCEFNNTVADFVGAPKIKKATHKKSGLSFVIVTHAGTCFINAIKSVLHYHPDAEVIFIQTGQLPPDQPEIPDCVKHYHIMQPIPTTSNRNIGLSFVSNNTVVFLDADAALMSPVVIHNNCIQGGLIIQPDNKVWAAGAFINGDFNGEHRYGNCDLKNPMLRKLCEVDYVPGCFMVCPTTLLEKLNGFDDVRLTTYYDDVDLCYRARAIGCKTIYNPAMRVFHDTRHSRINTDRFNAMNETDYCRANFKAMHQAGRYRSMAKFPTYGGLPYCAPHPKLDQLA